MIRLANVLIAEQDRDRAAALTSRLAGGGYHAASVATAAEALALETGEHPDLILIGRPRDGDPLDLAKALKSSPVIGDIPVLLLAEAESAEVWGRAFDVNVDDVIAAGCGDEELFARLRPLVRLSTMHAELRQRARTAAQLGIAARERVDGGGGERPAILLIGDLAAGLRTVLAADADLTLSGDLFEAEDLLTRRNFDAALVGFSSTPESLLGFCSQVRHNPRLFNLPLLLLGAEDPGEAYRKGASRVLPWPADAALLRLVMLTMVRRQQLRWSIRAALNDTLTGAARDALTGAYSRPYLDRYLGDRVAIAVAQDRHLSVIFLAAPSIDGVRRQFGEDAAIHLTQQVGQWVTGLLRAEDLTAFYGPGEFCVVLPDTPFTEAEVVMHRIAGVLAYTDFAVREVYQPVKVWVQVGGTDTRAGDDLAALVARARHNLD